MRSPVLLVVDDDSDVRRFLSSALEHAGFTVLTGGNSGTLPRCDGPIDLLIADASAASPSLIRALTECYPAIRILLTADPGENLGGALVKPFTYSQLIDRVRLILHLSNTAHNG